MIFGFKIARPILTSDILSENPFRETVNIYDMQVKAQHITIITNVTEWTIFANLIYYFFIL